MSIRAITHSAPAMSFTLPPSTLKEDAEINVSTVLDLLENDDLESADIQCNLIPKVYSRNIGRALIALAYLAEFDFEAAKSQLDRAEIIPRNPLDNVQSAKNAIGKVMMIMQDHLASGSYNPIFSGANRKIVLGELNHGLEILPQKIVQTMDKIDRITAQAKLYQTALLTARQTAVEPIKQPSAPISVTTRTIRDDTCVFELDE